MTIITTPSGYEAELLVENAWGPEKKSAGLRYIDDEARRRLAKLFCNCDDTFNTEDIAADMKEYHFGYADDVPNITSFSIRGASNHVFPLMSVDDQPTNAIWHCDKLRVQYGYRDISRLMEPNAVTMLYADQLDPSRPKEIGFGHPQIIADAYNDFYGEDLADGNALSLRDIAVKLVSTWGTHEKIPEKTAYVRDILQATYARSAALLQEQGIVGTYWIPYAQKRLIMFANDIVHCSDHLKQENLTPRKQTMWRRMLPGRPMMGFNTARD